MEALPRTGQLSGTFSSMKSDSGSWLVHTRHASATELHRIDALPEGEVPQARMLTLCRPSAPAVVLGSTQTAADLDMAAVQERGLEVAHRRSGGGAVFVDPEDSVWIDAWIPRNDALWVDDVSASMLWLGRAWVAALGDAVAAEMITDPYDAGAWGRTVCFLSSAPGEVRGPQGKLVGISQRRDRHGARLQCVLYRRWDRSRWAVFSEPGAARALDAMAVDCVDLEPDVVLARLLDALS